MYQIAICDDEIKQLDKIENIVKAYMQKYNEFSIERFKSAEDLLYMVREKAYMPCLMFMDILMSGKSGIELARELRKMGVQCGIVFITNSKEYALEAFGVNAVQYLIKPVCDSDIFGILDKFMKDKKEDDRKYILLKADGNIRKIAVYDILYCEALRKKQYIYMSDGTELLQSITMSKLYEKLSEYEMFVRIGVSYIINLEHVTDINVREVYMDNGKVIYIPRGAYTLLREQFFGYYSKEM